MPAYQIGPPPPALSSPYNDKKWDSDSEWAFNHINFDERSIDLSVLSPSLNHQSSSDWLTRVPGAHSTYEADRRSNDTGRRSSRTSRWEGGLADPENANKIGWNGDDDPDHPFNWPVWRRNINAGVITFLAFLTPLASSIIAPGVSMLMAEFESSSTVLAAFVVSVFVLGSAFGPLLLSPLSEIYGRLPIYHIANVGFIVFNVACAEAPNLSSLIVFRFFTGFFGSCPITNGGASIADMCPPERRGLFMGLFAVGPLLGPVIGPVAAGFLSEAMGWRWIFWLIVIVSGFVSVILFIFGRETYHPTLLQRRVDRLREKTGNTELRSSLDSGLSPVDKIKRGIVRPLKLLVMSPIGIACALYLAVVYGYMYLMFSSVTSVFRNTYGITGNLSGLIYLGLGIGALIGMTITSIMSDRAVKKSIETYGKLKPEARLGISPIGGALLPAGLFIYGWTAEYGVHWIVPIIGMTIMGVGNVVLFMSICLYLIDTFETYSASALAANTVIRSLGGGLLPLAGLSMFAALGVGWGISLLGFIAVAMIPIPVLLLRYGEYLRTRFVVKNL